MSYPADADAPFAETTAVRAVSTGRRDEQRETVVGGAANGITVGGNVNASAGAVGVVVPGTSAQSAMPVGPIERRQARFAVPKPPTVYQGPSNIFRAPPPLPMHQNAAPGRLSYQTSIAPSSLRPPAAHTLLHQRGERMNLRNQFEVPDRRSIRSSGGRTVSVTPLSSVSSARIQATLQQAPHIQYRSQLSKPSDVKQHLTESVSRGGGGGGGGGNITMIGTTGSSVAGGMRERVVKEERDIANKDWQQERMRCLILSLNEWGYGNLELNKVCPASSKEFLKIVYFLTLRLSPYMYEFIKAQFGECSPEAPEFVANLRAYSFPKTVGRSHITAISPMSWKHCCAFLDWLHTEIKLKEETANVSEYLLRNLLCTVDEEGHPVAGMSEETRRQRLATGTGLEIGLALMESFYQAHATGGRAAVNVILQGDEFRTWCGQKLAEALGCDLVSLTELRRQVNDINEHITAHKQRPTVESLSENITHFAVTVAKAELDNHNTDRQLGQLKQELTQLQADAEKSRTQLIEVEARIRETEQFIDSQSMSSEDAEDMRRDLEVLQASLLTIEEEVYKLDDSLSDLHVEVVRLLQDIGEIVRKLESILFDSGALNYFGGGSNADINAVNVIKPVMPTGQAAGDAEFSRDYVQKFLLCMQHWEQQLDLEAERNNEALAVCNALRSDVKAKKQQINELQDTNARAKIDEAAQHQQEFGELERMIADTARLKAENISTQLEIQQELDQMGQMRLQMAKTFAGVKKLKKENDDADSAIPGLLQQYVTKAIKPNAIALQESYADLTNVQKELLELANNHAGQTDAIRRRLELLDADLEKPDNGKS